MTQAEASVGVFTTDRELVVRSWDAWLARATGVPERDACGRPLAELFPDVAARGFVRRLRRVADEGVVEVLAPVFHSHLIPCPPREPSRHFARMQQHVTVAPLRAQGAIAGVVVTVEDVTARLDRERDLAAALASPDDEVRRAAESSLAERGDDATASLAGALGDDRWRVRRAAAEQLAKGPAGAAEVLLSVIAERHRDPGALNAALAGLGASTEDVVPPLVALLDSADAEVRTYAALALGHLRDARAVPALLRLLDDADVNARQHAIEALGRIGAREAAPALAAVVETRDFFLAFSALDAISAIGDASVAPRLLPLLDDEVLAQAAAEALARVGGAEAAEPIASLLGREGIETPALASALAALHERLGGRDAVEVEVQVRAAASAAGVAALVAALGRADDRELPSLVRVLSWADAPDAETYLAPLLTREVVRHEVAEVLARRGARTVDPLLEALGHDDPEVRKSAAAALGRIGSARAVPALVRALDDEPDVTVAVAGALGAIGDREAWEPLGALFGHEDPAVRQAAVAAASSIAHPEMPARIRAMLEDPSGRVRESAARVAGYFSYDDCLAPMLALARDEDEAVRRVAVEHLAYYDDPHALRLVAEACAGDERPAVRAAAARALALASPGDALAPLLGALRDGDRWVRYHAARSLGAQRLAAAAGPLADLARGDDVPPVRLAAIEALGEIAQVVTPDGVVAALARLELDVDAEVAAAARRARDRLTAGDGRAPDGRAPAGR